MAATATTDLFELLDREWCRLCAGSALTMALRRWGSEDEALAALRTAEQLVAYVECRETDGASRDAVLAALAARAGTEALAARVVLQLVLPGLRSLLRRFFWREDPERVADVVTTVYARIHAIGAEPRPTWVAQRLFECARMRLRTLVRQDRRRVSAELLAGQPGHERSAGDSGWPASPASHSALVAAALAERAAERTAADELAELLEQATATGRLAEADVEVIRLYRLDHVSDADAAVRYGRVAASHQRRRQRAENRLRAVVAGAA